jgi:hypothetical protein
MTLRKWLIFTLGVALLALIGGRSFGLSRLGQAQQCFEPGPPNIVPSTKELKDASNLRRLSVTHLISANSANRASIEQKIAKLDSSVDRHFATFGRAYIADDTKRTLLQMVAANTVAYGSARQNFSQNSNVGDQDDANATLQNAGARDNASKTLQTAFDSRNG